MLKKIIILKKRSHILIVGLIMGLCLVSMNLLAQTPHIDSLKTQPKDSVALDILKSDTSLVKADSLRPADTKGMDSLQIKNSKGDIETTIYYHAEDSIMMDVVKKKAYLYGEAQIKYQSMQLDAEQIEIEWEKNIITARGKTDTTGKYIGYPVWKQGQETYVTDSMRYNMKTQKGIIHGIVTKQGEGYLHGDTAKRTEDAIFLKNGIYTTCDLKHPHFYINARKLKVIPEDKALSGPFNMVIEDIPTPIGFWLGFFPITDKKKSGIIFPAFGENASRGLYFSNGGYYWAVNDYLGVKLEGDLYANGSWRASLNNTYIKRYKFRGIFDLSGSKIKEGFDNPIPVPSQFRVYWQHATIAKRNGTFTANVSLTSSKYDKTLNYTPTRSNNVSTSSITYNRVFGRSPFSTSISMRGSQNNYQSTATNNQSAIYNMTLPAATLTMNRINPLKRKYGDGNKWFEKIFVNYQGNFTYDLTNVQKFYDTATRALKDSTLHVNERTLNNYILPNAKWTSNHNAAISSTFKVFKFLNVNPSVNNFFSLYGKKLSYQYDPATRTSPAIDTANGLYATYYMNTAVEVNTRLYGTLQFKGNGLVKGIRHTANPSVRMTYAPDFSKMTTGGYVAVPGDVDKNGETRRYSQYFNNTVPQFKQAVLDFTLSNILEAKVRNRKDTTGTNKYKKINLLDNLSMAGGYNFGADSLRMKNVTLNARTNLFKRFDINFNSVFDPYSYYADSIRYIGGRKIIYNGGQTSTSGRQINTYLFEKEGRLAQLSTMNFTVGTRFAPKKKSKELPKVVENPQMQAELDYIKAHPEQYVDFTIPWSLALSFTYNYSRVGLADPVINQAVTASGDISLTPKWKIIYSTGYNFKDKSITYSNFTISRDLHCWQMNMMLSPFGSYRTFLFTISAKSSMLQQLKLNKRAATFIQ